MKTTCKKPSIDVLTLNVRYGTARDGRDSWPRRREIMVRMLEDHRPILVGTQECLDFQRDFLQCALPHYGWAGIGRDENGAGEMSGILYDRREWEKLEEDTFWLSESPRVSGSVGWDARFPRICTTLMLRHRESDRRVHMFNTHLDHAGRQAREEGAKMIGERIDALSRDALVILTGDFNAVAQKSPSWIRLTEIGLKDAWLAAHERTGPSTTFGGFAPPDPHLDLRIDWIMVRGPWKVRRCETITDHESGRYPTDHFPVLAALEFG